MAMDFDTLKEILRKHKLWLNQEAGGEPANLHRADLRGICLRGIDLSGADLSNSDLSGADLHEVRCCNTNFYEADLHHVDLYKADLSMACLYKANLSCSILSGADLSGADLSEADLSGADLSGANLAETDLFCPMACPDVGSFIGWKIVPGNYIVKLLIPEDAKRSSATGRKCRCNKAKVISIENLDGTPSDNITVHSTFDSNFIYELGSVVEVENFDENRFNECAPGIHFFITRQEAVNYGV